MPCLSSIQHFIKKNYEQSQRRSSREDRRHEEETLGKT